MTRVRIVVAAAAFAAALATVGVVALTRENVAADAGPPPALALQVDEGTPLARAVSLYEAGRYDEARALFEASDTPEGVVGAAFCRWPDDTLELLGAVEDEPVGRLHLAIATSALGDEPEAERILRTVEPLDRDSPYAVRAEDFLHPRFVPGVPLFVPVTERPALLEAAQALREGRRLTARRLLGGALAAAPDDPELLTAAAVAEFDKDEPARAFSRLGPLSRRFPRAQTVRFHLGLLLVWIADADGAVRQFERARALGPRTRLGRDAGRFIAQLRTP